MAITLTSLPPEVLLHISKCLTEHSDVASFRLVCALFADIGFPSLSTRVTVVALPESIDRLRDISLHPFFRHHITTITLLLNVFYPYKNEDGWKESMKFFESYEYNTQYTSTMSDRQWNESMMFYDALLADQGRGVKLFEPSQGFEMACRRFTNLQHLELRDYRAASLPPYQLSRNYIYNRLHEIHGDLRCWFHLPTYNSSIFPSEVGLPGIYLLRSLLAATSQSQPRTLRVDALAIDVFDDEDETETYTRMREAFPHLRSLKLCLCAKFLWERWEKAQRIMSNNRIKTLLCSAPHLEDVELTYRTVFYEPSTYYTNITHMLPSEHTWPRLRRLRLTNVKIVIPIFLGFFSSHEETLKFLELEDCAIVPALDQGLQHQRCLWSDIFIPLATCHSILALSLSGRFVLQEPPDPGLIEVTRVWPPYIHMDDRVQGVQIQHSDLTVGKAIEMVVCSKEFESFLGGEVGGCNEITSKIKEGIIKDLMDHNAMERVGNEPISISTRYEDSIREFNLATQKFSLPQLEWWPEFTDPQSMQLPIVDWPMAVMEMHEWAWHHS